MQNNMNFLDRNEFNFEPSPEVKEVIRNFDYKKLCFYTRIYDQGKKSIFSEYLSGLYGIDEKQILLGYGAEDLLKKAVHFFLLQEGSNKVMMIPKFSWWYYSSIAGEVDGKTVQYPVYEEEKKFSYDFEHLKAMVQEVKPKILLVASPNNPTGNGLTGDQLEELATWAPEDTIILVDEAYASFVTDDISYIKRIINKYSNFIFCRTLSKFYGLPGLRMGFGFTCRSELLDRFCRYANMYLGYDRMSEDIAIAAIKSDSYYRHIAELMQQARDMYETEIGALSGFKVYHSIANFILIKYPIELKEELQKEFAEVDYKVKFMNEPDINSHMRITLGRPEQNRQVADVILDVVKKHHA